MLDSRAVLVVMGVLGALAAIGYAAAKKAGVLPGPNTFNPLSDENLAYRGANEVFRAITGNQVDTIGTALASGYSDQVGREITAPYIIGRPASGESYVSAEEFLANAEPSRAGAAWPWARKP